MGSNNHSRNIINICRPIFNSPEKSLTSPVSIVFTAKGKYVYLPVMSEEAAIPYVFVPSKEELGHASSTKRPTSCVMVCPDQKKKSKPKEGATEDKDDDYRETYDECCKEIQLLDQKLIF